MIDKVLRSPKETVMLPIAQRLLHSVHPISITLMAALFGIAAGGAVWQQQYGLGLALWILNRILDGLDGTVARLYNKQSDLGAYLDIVLDTIVYALIPVALAISINTSAGYISLAFLLSSFYINNSTWMYLAALLEKQQQGATTQDEKTSTTMPGGLIEGAETIVFFSLFLLFPGAMIPLFAMMTMMVLVTATQRIVWAQRYL